MFPISGSDPQFSAYPPPPEAHKTHICKYIYLTFFFCTIIVDPTPPPGEKSAPSPKYGQHGANVMQTWCTYDGAHGAHMICTWCTWCTWCTPYHLACAQHIYVLAWQRHTNQGCLEMQRTCEVLINALAPALMLALLALAWLS